MSRPLHGLARVVIIGLLLTAGRASAQGDGPAAGASLQAALGTAFTYQGRLTDGGNPANGSYDLRFIVYNADVGGAQAGSTVDKADVPVTGGLFTVSLDFGPDVFTGEARWLEISVRPGLSGGGYTVLSPRQPLTPAPYALALPGLHIQQNATSPNLIGGFISNTVTSGVVAATISGGGKAFGCFSVSCYNQVTDDYGTVSGGISNRAGDGVGTLDDGSGATVGGGSTNIAGGLFATIGGGFNNTIAGLGQYGTIGGGHLNYVDNSWASIGGGFNNYAAGQYATVPGGGSNSARGNYSFAAGNAAQANHTGAFVWADASGGSLVSNRSNQFLVRASGGITLYTNSGNSIGVSLLPSDGTWNTLSDVNAKRNIQSVNAADVLERLMMVPIHTWNYEGSAIPHIGPMAQDFYLAYGVGMDDKHIATVDADGVAFAAIQGLHQAAQAQDARIAALEARIADLEQGPEARPALVPDRGWLLWLLGGGLLLFNVGWSVGRRFPKGGRP